MRISRQQVQPNSSPDLDVFPAELAKSCQNPDEDVTLRNKSDERWIGDGTVFGNPFTYLTSTQFRFNRVAQQPEKINSREARYSMKTSRWKQPMPFSTDYCT
eukprot:4691635-Pleurochrysis_carterae.AAC.1